MILIDADALKANIEEKDRYNLGGEHRIVVCGMLDDAPTVDAEPVKHGRWIQRRNGQYYCNNCGREERFIYQKNYCPKCGAKMDGVESNIQRDN